MMTRSRFQQMWQTMQRRGYFEHHPHYRSWFSEVDDEPVDPVCRELLHQLSSATTKVVFPNTDEERLQRLIKIDEAVWLPRLFDFRTGSVGLDLGCGFGRTLAWMHSWFDQMIGVDVSQHAIDLARQRLQGVANVQLMVSDGAKLPLTIADGSVDLIYSLNLFEHIPRSFTKSYLRDFARVLAPGGRAVFNLLSGVRQLQRSGRYGSEWSIGYSQRAIRRLLRNAGLVLERQVIWRLQTGSAHWVWVEVRRQIDLQESP
jgi:SAM-dependent methyltransferase